MFLTVTRVPKDAVKPAQAGAGRQRQVIDAPWLCRARPVSCGRTGEVAPVGAEYRRSSQLIVRVGQRARRRSRCGPMRRAQKRRLTAGYRRERSLLADDDAGGASATAEIRLKSGRCQAGPDRKRMGGRAKAAHGTAPCLTSARRPVEWASPSRSSPHGASAQHTLAMAWHT